MKFVSNVNPFNSVFARLITLIPMVMLTACVYRMEVRSMEAIEVLPLSEESRAFDVNNNGFIVGESTSGSYLKHAIMVSPASEVTNLGTLETGWHSVAHGINNNNEVVGRSYIVGSDGRVSQYKGFFWRAGRINDLGGIGKRINDNGLAGGTSELSGMIYDINDIDPATTLPSKESVRIDGEFRPSRVNDINNIDGYVGWFSEDVAFYNREGTTYRYKISSVADSEATGVTEWGSACGVEAFRNETTGQTNYHAVFWPTFNTIIDLGTLGGRHSRATDINSSQVVVGYSDTASGRVEAFAWHEDVGMIPLGTLAGGESKAHTAPTGSHSTYRVRSFIATLVSLWLSTLKSEIPYNNAINSSTTSSFNANKVNDALN